MKIAVVVSGWHYPLHFYTQITKQKLPQGWSVDFFCVSHRNPKYSIEEKKEYLSKLDWSYREALDKILYEKFADISDIENLGWVYMECPNTVGDWGNTNQWLEKYDYKKYDILLISHDDNLILNDRLYVDLLTGNTDWLILTNSTGSYKNFRQTIKSWFRPINIRGSFEFIKSEVLDILGGKFDLSTITKTREGKVDSGNFKTLNNWNMITEPLISVFNKKGMRNKIVALSKNYRVSDYCIEGERGFISSVQKLNKKGEDRGLRRFHKIYG